MEPGVGERGDGRGAAAGFDEEGGDAVGAEPGDGGGLVVELPERIPIEGGDPEGELGFEPESPSPPVDVVVGTSGMSSTKPVAVVVGATSKWQADGRNTLLAHGEALDDGDVPIGRRWGIGGAVAQRFAAEGCFVVLTTRTAANAKGLKEAIGAQGGECIIVELDLASEQSVVDAFHRIRTSVGDPSIVVYNAGYLEGRDLPPEKELLEHLPVELFDTALHIAARGPFLVAKEVLPAMRAAGQGTFLITNNPSSLRGRKRYTGQSLYYPRVMMRALAQVLTEEYSEHGVHVANVIVDGLIDSPGTRALPIAQKRPESVMDPEKIADAYWYLHTQDPSVWSHELQLTPHVTKPSF